jgi:ATP-dependent Lhr-like helicase
VPSTPAAFDLLHPKVQRWIYEQGWEELRDIQERSIPVLLDGSRDAIVAAATASGKTEAAFLPILSSLARLDEEGRADGFGALYVSPLKALINDQFRRLEELCERLELPVFKWHGDVAASTKQRARSTGRGVVLITPESLEALLVRRGGEARGLFRHLPYVVVDELHAFIGEPRGKQLQSLLHRLDRVAGRRVTRVGLSATLADLAVAAAFLRPDEPSRVEILEAKAASLHLKLRLRGYVDPVVPPTGPGSAPSEEAPGPAEAAMASHLFHTLRGRKGLLFAGSRRKVELFSKALGDLCERAGIPGEFLPTTAA